MQRTSRVLIAIGVATLVTLMALSAAAIESRRPPTKPLPTDDRLTSSQNVHASRIGHSDRASDLIGLELRNTRNEYLGSISDLVVDLPSGHVVLVLLSDSGLAGIGETIHALPPSVLYRDLGGRVARLNVDQEKLTAGPLFESTRWTEATTVDALKRVYLHYGVTPYVAAARAESFTAPYNLRRTDTMPSDEPIQSANSIIGRSVMNDSAQTIGAVNDLLVNLNSGRVLALVVSSGAFMGIANHLSAIPIRAFRFDTGREALTLDASPETLRGAPHFTPNQWPDFDRQSTLEAMSVAYKPESALKTGGAHEPNIKRQAGHDTYLADSTGQKLGARDASAPTPLDQESRSTDTSTTARVLRAIITAQGLSVNARNIRVITLNGRLTLSGVVDSANEKLRLGEIANSVVRTENVDNQLEVK